MGMVIVEAIEPGPVGAWWVKLRLVYLDFQFLYDKIYSSGELPRLLAAAIQILLKAGEMRVLIRSPSL